jgi:hypothetical protein
MVTRLFGIILIIGGLFIWAMMHVSTYNGVGIFIALFAILVGAWIALNPPDRGGR